MSKAFTKPELNPKHLMLVDSLNLAFRWKHQKKFDFKDEYITTVESLRRSYGCGKVIILCDYGSSSYRKSIYPEYKIGRKLKQAEATPEEQAEFELFFEGYLETIEAFSEFSSYPVLRYQGVEADDLGAYITKKSGKLGIKKVSLISSDKDWDLLISAPTTAIVNRFSYVTRKDISLENWYEHHECDPSEYISIKCLQGDEGDSVPGVPGIGPKKAQALVREYGSTYDIIANMPIISKYKHIHNLNEFGTDALMRNYQLMDLLEFCEEAIGSDNIKDIDRILNDYLN